MAARPGQQVLNLFAYGCAFSVVALQAGTRQVVNVDMAGGALSSAEEPPNRSTGWGRGELHCPDIFASWGKIKRSRPYDLVILGP